MTKAVNIRVLFFGAARDAVEANQRRVADQLGHVVVDGHGDLPLHSG